MVDAIGAPLVEYFQALDDPRIPTKRHHLLDILPSVALFAAPIRLTAELDA